MNEIDRQNMITEGRQLLVAAPALEPLLTQIEKIAKQELLGNFRDGKDLATATAKLYVIQQIRQMIDSKINLMNSAASAGVNQ